jgi:hypothetical protein
MFSQIFPMRNMGRLCAAQTFVKIRVVYSNTDQHCFSDVSNTIIHISSISHQPTIAEHGDLPNTEIFQSKDVTSGNGSKNFPFMYMYCLDYGGYKFSQYEIWQNFTSKITLVFRKMKWKFHEKNSFGKNTYLALFEQI